MLCSLEQKKLGKHTHRGFKRPHCCHKYIKMFHPLLKKWKMCTIMMQYHDGYISTCFILSLLSTITHQYKCRGKHKQLQLTYYSSSVEALSHWCAVTVQSKYMCLKVWVLPGCVRRCLQVVWTDWLPATGDHSLLHMSSHSSSHLCTHTQTHINSTVYTVSQM